MQFDQSTFKSGFVTFIGRPNAGKSTLINRIMGTKIAITSSTAQTTRHRFRAVKTTDDYQLVLVDTPGLHKPHDDIGFLDFGFHIHESHGRAEFDLIVLVACRIYYTRAREYVV